MSAEWTAERLAALPECTTVSYSTEGTGWTIVKGKGDAWFYVLLGRVRASAHIIANADPGSIRVISVPIDALLNPGPADVRLGSIDPTSAGALMVIRAAIAHAIGEQSQ